MFLGIGLTGAKVFSRVTLIPRELLWPAVFVFSMVGSYAFASSIVDVWIMLISGIVGFIMRRHGFGPAPMVMGLILGTLVEENLSRSMIIYDNNWWRFFESPIVDLFFALTCISLLWPLISKFLTRRAGRE
jgi:putative tricarboxylic transport membrane protein